MEKVYTLPLVGSLVGGFDSPRGKDDDSVRADEAVLSFHRGTGNTFAETVGIYIVQKSENYDTGEAQVVVDASPAFHDAFGAWLATSTGTARTGGKPILRRPKA